MYHEYLSRKRVLLVVNRNKQVTFGKKERYPLQTVVLLTGVLL